VAYAAAVNGHDCRPDRAIGDCRRDGRSPPPVVDDADASRGASIARPGKNKGDFRLIRQNAPTKPSIISSPRTIVSVELRPAEGIRGGEF